MVFDNPSSYSFADTIKIFLMFGGWRISGFFSGILLIIIIYKFFRFRKINFKLIILLVTLLVLTWLWMMFSVNFAQESIKILDYV
jgi:hypothetical protein